MNPLNHETDKEVFYFTSEFNALDSFSAHAIDIWGRTFATAEHAYQWKKFSENNPVLAEKILVAPSPYAVKKISNMHKENVDPKFTAAKLEVMKDIYVVKLNQHQDVREALIKTGNKIIIENSPTDSFWGIGPDGNGQNHLGKIWMELRDAL